MNNNAFTSDRAEVNSIPLLGPLLGPLSGVGVEEVGDDPLDMVCLSRLRWDFARQRPQHLMSRSARERRVFFVEEPVFGETIPGLDIRRRDCGVFVVTPQLRDPYALVNLTDPSVSIPKPEVVTVGTTSAFKTSTGLEVRFFMPVLNVPFRLIMAWNPQRGNVLDQSLQPAKSFTFRFAVGTTF